MGECAVTSKVCLTFLCLLFWAAGAGLLFIGIEVFLTYNNIGQLSSATYTLVPAIIIIAIGVFMFLLGLIGCIGGCKESKCLLALFFTVLLVILMGEVAAGFLGFAYRGLVENAVKDGMNKALTNYTEDATLKHEVDYVQENLQCCGVTNYTDWFTTPWGVAHPGRVPTSCCEDRNCTSMNEFDTSKIFDSGCMLLLKDKFNTYLGVIAGVAFGFALLEILGMICSCILLCRTQKDLPYAELHEDHGGIRA